MLEEIRAKIETTKILNLLGQHVKDEVKMESTQIRAAEILLNKTIPNLSAIEQSISPDSVDVIEELFKFVRNTSRTIPDGS